MSREVEFLHQSTEPFCKVWMHEIYFQKKTRYSLIGWISAHSFISNMIKTLLHLFFFLLESSDGCFKLVDSSIEIEIGSSESRQYKWLMAKDSLICWTISLIPWVYDSLTTKFFLPNSLPFLYIFFQDLIILRSMFGFLAPQSCRTNSSKASSSGFFNIG